MSCARFSTFFSLATFLTAFFFFPESAMAQDSRYTVYLFPIEQSGNVPEGVPVKVEEYFRTILGINSKIKIAEEPSTAQQQHVKTDKSVKMEPAIEKAQSLLGEGKEFINGRKYSKALPLLEESRELFRKNLHNLEDFDQFIDASLNLALAYFQEGYNDNAEEMMKSLVAMRPELTLDGGYPKDFQKAIKKIKEKIKAKKTSTVSIDVIPQNSRIYVDGILVGEGKQSIKLPANSKHFLKVVLDGYKMKSQNFKAPGADKSVSLKIDLEPTEETAAALERGEQPRKEGLASAIQRGEFDKTFFAEAKELSSRLKTDFIIFGFLTKTEVAYHYGIFIYRTGDGKLVFLEPSAIDLDLANMQIVLLDAESRLIAALTNFPEEKVVKGTPPIYTLVPKAVPKKKEAVVIPVKVNEQPKVEETAMLPAKKEEAAKKEEPVAVTTEIEELPPDFPMLFEEEDRDYWYKKWWIWTIVGAVVIGGGAGIYYLTSPSSGDGNFSADLKW